MICENCKKEIDKKFKFIGFSKDNFFYPCEANFIPNGLFCTSKQASDYIFEKINQNTNLTK